MSSPSVFIPQGSLRVRGSPYSIIGLGDSCPKACRNDNPRKNHGIQILESVSFGGSWTLCWIDHPFLGNFNSSSEQRITLLEHLISSKSLAHLINKTGKFFPVFGETDSPEMVAAMMTELKNRHPTLIGKRWFIENKKEGIIIQAENHSPS